MRGHALKLLAILIVGSLAVALAAAPPNLSGTWKGNIAKSDFGQMPAPTSFTSKIDHKDPSLKVASTYVSDQGEMTFEMTINTDGTETTNQMGPFSMKTKAKWEGSALMVESKGSSDNGEFTTKEKWTLSEDGKTLRIARSFSGPMGEMTQTVVHDKQ